MARGGRGRFYALSDTHFGHAEIIQYCNRPYKDAEEMDRMLMANWNSMVKPWDTVYFLGDMCRKGELEGWLKRLNGRIVLIRGNHDPDWMGSHRIRLEYRGVRLVLVHNPNHAEQQPNEWILHGHHHNNDQRYPFFNPERRTFNLSVEQCEYKPVPLDYIVDLIRSAEPKAD
jgi:calcineurin-like phosphoesterase family protein